VEEATDVLDHDGLRPRLVHQTDSRRKEVTLVILAELLARDGERRAGKPPGQQVHAFVSATVESVEVFLVNDPFWPVQAECLAAVTVNLDQSRVAEAGLFESERLAARAG